MTAHLHVCPKDIGEIIDTVHGEGLVEGLDEFQHLVTLITGDVGIHP
jgi:hypothetical protein